MVLNSLKIRNMVIDIPIFQGGMGVGVSWDQLAGTVSKEGGFGIISAAGTGYYKNQAFIKNQFQIDLIKRKIYTIERLYLKFSKTLY